MERLITTETLIHFANVLYLASYFMRQMLWLRVLTVVAASFLILYFWFQSTPMMAPVLWNLVFLVLNLAWIVWLVIKKRDRSGRLEQAQAQVVKDITTKIKLADLFERGPVRRREGEAAGDTVGSWL